MSDKRQTFFKVIFAGLFLTAVSAQAGTVLRFQNGNLKPNELVPGSALFSSFDDDFVIQFKDSITEKDKAELIAAGVQIFRYIPDDALVVRATTTQLSSFAQNGKINGFVPFKGQMKLSSNLPTFSIFSTAQTSLIVISAFSAQDASDVLAYLQSRDPGVLVLDQTGRSLLVRMNQALVAELAQVRGIEFIQKAEKLETMHMDLSKDLSGESTDHPGILSPGDYSDINGYETGTKVMNFDSIWALGFHGKDQIAGMADTGLDVGNIDGISSDFQGAIKSGYSFGIGAKSWEDPMGHGTHVAGSVVSRGVASGGKLRGGAYEAQIIPEGMWSTIIDNLTVPPKLVKLFEPAYADGARVHTNSWGAAANFGAYDSMAQQVDEFMWAHPDFLVLFAAGNSGVDKDKDGRIDPNSIGSPGTAKNILTVGASENLLDHGGIQKQIKELGSAKDKWPAEPIWSSKVSDNVDGIAMFSSRGPTTDGRRKPEIVAPGTNVLSARSHNPTAEVLWGAYNADYVYSGGTSMATPLVAGAALVTREVLIKRFGVANPSAALVKATLMHTAHDMYPGQYGQSPATQELKTHRPNNDEGYGRVDMDALAKLSTGTQVFEQGVAQGESFTQKVDVKAGKLLVNMVYTDSPGSPAAGAALVNDLDLVVTGPDGKIFESKDIVNNNEMVEASGLLAGSYSISVRGVKIPMGKEGKQPFALIVTAH